MFGFQSKPVFIIDTGNFTNISALSMFSVCDNEFVQQFAIKLRHQADLCCKCTAKKKNDDANNHYFSL